MDKIKMEQRKLNSEKNLSKCVLKSQQEKLKKKLLGEMGEDIDAVLSGERVIGNVCKKNFFQKIKSRFSHIIRRN